MMLHEDVAPLWRASALTLGVLLMLVVGLVTMNLLSGRDVQAQIDPKAGAGLMAVPATTWTLLLYQIAGRRRAQISTLLPTILVLSALAAAAAVRPFLFELLDIDLWLTQTNASNRFLGNILTIGMVNAFALYGLIRYTVWRTPAFAHRVDGVLYTTAAGWGYGTTLIVLSLLDQEAVTVLNGGLKALSQLCAYLAPALIVGYFLGRNRFEDMPFYYLSTGLLIAAALNGLLLYAGSELNNVSLSLTQDGFSPWPGFAASLGILVVTYLAIYGLLRRHNSLTRARLEAQQ